MKGKLITFEDFRDKAGERGLPTGYNYWVEQEKKGLITFRKLPSGWRTFKDYQEINDLLDRFENGQNP